MIKSFRDRKETNRLLCLNRSSHSERTNPPKPASAPFMRGPKYSNPMLVGGPVAALPVKISYSGASYPRSPKQTAFSHSALALSVSVTALLLSLTSGAQAQNTIPVECTTNPSLLAAGGTLTCVVEAPAEVGPIVTTLDGITINIGTDGNPTTVRNTNGPAIKSTSSGNLIIDSTNGSVAGSEEGIKVEILSPSGASVSGTIRITTADVTGENGRGISLLANSLTSGRSLIIDSSAGNVEGTGGIYVQGHFGAESINITTADVTGSVDDGIRAIRITPGATGRMTINSMAGTVIGERHGIYASRTNRDTLSITTAAVTGTTGDGIFARLISTPVSFDGNLEITATGAVEGAMRGIFAHNAGTGSISIMSAAVTGTAEHGIYANLSNASATGNISITASGAVIGAVNGINAQNNGSGTLSIDASTLGARGGTGDGNAGITVVSSGTGAISVINAGTEGIGSRAISITSTGALSGDTEGISATHTGDGAVSITSSNSVAGQAGDAISATTAGGNISISGAHTVTGIGGRGIFADSDGGDISIYGVGLGVEDDDATGGISGTTGHAIQADARGPTAGTGGNIIIGGSGENAIGDVSRTGSGNDGINVQTDGLSSSITINSRGGTVIGSNIGIYALNAGTGGISIISAAVTGTTDSGINARLTNNAATGDIEITTTGVVMGRDFGISASHAGSNAITISAAEVSASDGDAISATTAGGNISISGSRTITGTGGIGISAMSGGGDISISDAHTVTGTNGHGIFADSDGGNISIQGVGLIGGVSGSEGYGIHADASGGSGGNIIIGGSGENAIGDVTGKGRERHGINVQTDGIDSSITIDASGSTIMGRAYGINARNAGQNASRISITAADITGTFGDGIFASLNNSNATGDLEITVSGAIIGSISGIFARNSGTGTTRIKVSSVSASAGHGINTFTATRSSVTINAGGTVSGTTTAIQTNVRSGTITITADALKASAGDAIIANSVGGNISISGAHTITGIGGHGISASSGDGDISIQGVGLTGGVTGTAGHGIFADARGATEGTGGNINIGGITAIGTITSQGSDNSGIYARTEGAGRSITIDVSGGSVMASDGDAISATTAGGDVSISGAHTVRGSEHSIITDSGGGNISIQGVGLTGGVTGSAGHGIQADATGGTGGNINIGGITAIGVVSGSGSGNSGIYARNAGSSTITIAATAVSASDGDAIIADSGGGAISISGAHTVTGTGGRGIFADSDGGDISIQGVGLTGGVIGTVGHGIEADSTAGAGGSINIGGMTTIGNVTGTGSGTSGISAQTGGVGGSITIDASGGTTIGRVYGISARNAGSGASSIAITAANVTGTTDTGIIASLSNANVTGDIEITTTGAVIGRFTGILARNDGSGATRITVSSVSARAGFGIQTRTTAGASVTVNAGGRVSGSSTAIQTNVLGGDLTSTPADSVTIRGTVTGNIRTLTGDDTVTLAAGSRTTGITINLGEGNDTLDLASTAFGTLDAGVGDDTLSISGTGITLNGGAHSNFETLIFAAGAGSNTLSGTHTGFTTTSFNAGTTILTKSLTSTTAAVASGATLDLANGSSLSGDLTNSGTLKVSGIASGAATVTGDLTLGASGTLILYTNGESSNNDFLTVSGDVTLGGSLTIRHTSLVAGTVTLIDGGTSLSGDFEQISGVISGQLIWQTLTTDDTSFDLQLVTTVTTLDPNDQIYAGCTVVGDGTLMAGGTLNCISATPLTGTILTNVDGVTINVGSPDTPTIVNVPDDSDSNTNDDAIHALVDIDGTVGITIDTSSGTLIGGGRGILAYSAGTGTISLTTATVTGTTGDGISASIGNPSATSDLEITANGAVMGSKNGIYAQNEGSGTISIDASTLGASGGTGEENAGIRVMSGGTGAISVINAGSGGGGSRAISITTSGAAGGITATHTGDGAIRITSSNSVTANAGSAISATTASGSILIGGSGENAIGLVTGSVHGIYAQTDGSGEISINASSIGAIGGTGEGNAGIRVVSGGTGSISVINAGIGGTGSRAISITASGAVMGDNGISARNDGSGTISITSSNSVTGQAGDAISATTAVGDLSITTTGAVTGQYDGIDTRITNTSATGDMVITATGAVTGGDIGISAINEGTGGISIMSAAASSLFFDSQGIDARLNNTSATGDISITTTGTVMGGTTAISVQNLGTGGISIMSADVTGRSFGSRGIDARIRNSAANGAIEVTSTGTIMTGGFGIFAQNEGNNGITIEATTVSVRGGDAISANSAGGDISIRGAHTVLGTGGRGIFADSEGGDISIHGAGLTDGVTGSAGHGIYADARGATAGTGGNIIIGGSGENAIGAITGTGSESDGISAQTDGIDSTLTIEASGGSVIGGRHGISVGNMGTGTSAIMITTAAVTGMDGSGIDVRLTNGGATGGLEITASGVVMGGTRGIFARNEGTGRLSITSSNSVTGQAGDGINATTAGSDISISGTHTVTGTDGSGIFADSEGGDITIQGVGLTGGVTGSAGHGIQAYARGAAVGSGGNINIGGITAIGDVSGTGSGNSGINARTDGSGSSITIDSSGGAVRGDSRGLTVINAGTGAISIMSAAVTGTAFEGIDARLINNAATGDIEITTTGAVIGVSRGILAVNRGTAGLSITTAAVTGTGSGGIDARLTNNAATGDISITASGVVMGGTRGIFARNEGTGRLSITSSNSVTGQAGNGINATTAGSDISISGAHTVRGTGGHGILTDSDGGDISIQGVGATGGVTGTAGHGIFADARGATEGTRGNIIIGGSGDNAIGDVTGTGSESSGIRAQTEGLDHSITIDASGGTIMGRAYGIRARNAGTGASSIVITAADVTGSFGDGIYAVLSNDAVTGDIEITTSGAIIGRYTGIRIRNDGTGATRITVSSVSVSAGIAIQTRVTAGASVTVNAGGTVSGAVAIQTNVLGGDMTSTPTDSVTIRGTVTGNIRTLTGADTVTLAAGSRTTGITIDLGEGDDRLDLASTAFGTLDGGADTDTLSIGSTGIDLDGGAVSNFETLIFAAGSNTLSGTHTGLTSSTIATGAMLDLAAGSSLAGDLANSGMLTVAGSGFGSATITSGLTLSAGGTLTLDTAGMNNANDLLTVEGAVTLGGTLVLRQTTMPDGTVVLIDGVSLSGTFATTTGLISAPLISQAITYDGPSGQVRLVTTVITLLIDPAFPDGCLVTPVSPLADGGTLTCISATPITETIATTVDGVSIIIGESDTQTSVMNASGDGLSASIAGDSAAGSISINSEFSTISGGANGIVASSAGTGSINITAAAATGSGTNADGIVATLDNSNAAGNLSITATGAVSGSRHGISARNDGNGTISIDSSNSVTGQAGDGINATSGGGDISISGAHTVTGADGSGIFADSDGGDISIQGVGLTGGVTGSASHGIQAYARGSNRKDVLIGDQVAIGDVSSSASTSGIYVLADGGQSRIIINSVGTVMGGIGIYAINVRLGETSITAAEIIGLNGDAIKARSLVGGRITISGAHTVRGSERGIYADSNGGDISIQGVGLTGGVTGSTGQGIYADARGATAGTGGNINIGGITAIGAVTGTRGVNDGIFARTDGTGSTITITANGAVRGSGRGIYADSEGGDISIQGVGLTGGVTGSAGHGIEVDARGATGGNINIGGITAIGAVTSTGTRKDGIYAQTDGADSSITIDTSGGAVMGRNRGILATNTGSGASSISITTAVVTGRAGILARLAYTDATGGISITASGAVMGAINAFNYGTGGISITSAAVTASGYGLRAQLNNADATGDISITASGAVIGAISATNAGNGGISITSGNITSSLSSMLCLYQQLCISTGDVNITASGSVFSSNLNGILTRNAGTGGITIRGAHTVRGSTRGISADSGGGDISIQGVGLGVEGDDMTGGVTGSAGHGIEVDARGAPAGTGGNINIGGITAIGAVTGTGSRNSGIYVRTDGIGSSITIDSSGGAVMGGRYGISAINSGTGTTSITVASVSASAGTGILTRTIAGASVTVNAGGTVSGDYGNEPLSKP